MTPHRHSASPAVSGFDGAGPLPGVQAGLPRTSPSKVGASDFALGGEKSRRATTPRNAACGLTQPGPSAPLNDCGGVSRGHGEPTWPRRANPEPARSATRSEPTGPQSPICPELTAYITVLLTVIGAIAWAHVYAMKTTLEGELTHFHPRVMFCDAVGNKAEKLCAVRHKGAE